MTKLEKVVEDDDFGIDLYLGEVSNDQFRKDVLELKQEYSDNGAINRAIELLQFINWTHSVRK